MHPADCNFPDEAIVHGKPHVHRERTRPVRGLATGLRPIGAGLAGGWPAGAILKRGGAEFGVPAPWNVRFPGVEGSVSTGRFCLPAGWQDRSLELASAAPATGPKPG